MRGTLEGTLLNSKPVIGVPTTFSDCLTPFRTNQPLDKLLSTFRRRQVGVLHAKSGFTLETIIAGRSTLIDALFGFTCDTRGYNNTLLSYVQKAINNTCPCNNAVNAVVTYS